jgi:hypothetical protein
MDGMSIFKENADERVKGVSVIGDRLCIDLMDGRGVLVPLDWYPKLKAASDFERQNWQTCAAGYGIHWPAIDEDISVEGVLRLGSSRN